MGRTQVYLGVEELMRLEAAARASGATRSELIRRAIQATYGPRAPLDRIRAVRATAGRWRTPRRSGARYVDALRGDLNRRLRRLGLG
jgi:hypothetical protein